VESGLQQPRLPSRKQSCVHKRDLENSLAYDRDMIV
jgi:hypothetical protein